MALSAAIVVGTACVTARAETEAQRNTLVGLRAVHLQLDLRGDDLARFGLDEATLRPQLEARLTAAGIALLDVPASTREPGVPWLFVYSSVLKAPDGKEYAWSMRVELQQRACLERQTSVCESVATWAIDRLGSVGRRKVKTLTEDANDLLGRFVAAWQTANAKH